MQFTPQQLAGGHKFSPVTRIGNWQEEIALEEAKVSNFTMRSQNGNLALRKLETKMTICSEIVPHTYSYDGIIRFGDTVILQHDQTGSILACDPFDEIAAGQQKFLVSTVVDDPVAKARYTFRICRPPANMASYDDSLDDPIVHIGQSYLLACNESLLLKPGSKLLQPTLYLTSTKKNERMATKRTNRQMVYMTPLVNADSIWNSVVPSRGRNNAAGRFLAMGQPLNVSDAFQITHRQTNVYLACDAAEKTATEFGVEYEAYADRSSAAGKLGLVVSEFQGLSTSQTLSKPDAPIFAWHFVFADSPESAIDNRTLPPPANREAILLEVQEVVKARGVDAFWNLRSFFKQFELKMLSTGKIDREDLKACLRDWGINTPNHYLDAIVNLCSGSDMGLLDIKEFLAILRGPLSFEREDLVSAVYAKLDKDMERIVAIEELSKYFSGADHPLVTIGGFTEKEALEHLLQSFEVKGKMPRKVLYEKFCDYYADLSAAIEDDSYFETIVRSNWATLLAE
jgi:Ca2+-binding EF-hand superfamily protein